MAIAHTEPGTDRHDDTQENMFESSADFPGHDLIELPNESEDYGEPELAEFSEFEESSESNSYVEAAQEVTHNGLGNAVPMTIGPLSSDPKAKKGATAASPAYPNPDPDPAPEPNPTPDPEPPNLPLTIADFAALEDRVLRAVSLVRRERQARAAAEERAGFHEGRATALEARTADLEHDLLQFKEQTPSVEQLQQEIDALRQEREQVRHRVERLLGQLDALEL